MSEPRAGFRIYGTRTVEGWGGEKLQELKSCSAASGMLSKFTHERQWSRHLCLVAHLALQIEGERVPAGVVEPVGHSVRLEGLESLEVQEAVVVRIARRVSLPAVGALAAAGGHHDAPEAKARPGRWECEGTLAGINTTNAGVETQGVRPTHACSFRRKPEGEPGTLCSQAQRATGTQQTIEEKRTLVL